VSGVAALLIAQRPSRTPEEIRALLVSTAKHLGGKGSEAQFGAGLVDPLKALRVTPALVSDKQAAVAPPPAAVPPPALAPERAAMLRAPTLGR
jgi:membrane-anchored mycosin MYCP